LVLRLQPAALNDVYCVTCRKIQNVRTNEIDKKRYEMKEGEYTGEWRHTFVTNGVRKIPVEVIENIK